MDHKIEDKKIIENKQTVENKKAIEKKCCREIMISVMALTLTILLGGCGSNQDANGNSEITHSTTQSEVSGGEKEENKDDAGEYDITLSFAGDINFDENWSTMEHYKAHDEDISQCIDPELIDDMQDADLMWINNEFTYSDRGTPMAGKAYTFRANPARVNILKELGVDIVGLANNHVYDYGNDALLDTFSTLEDAEIPYVGAGRNIKEASSPIYRKVDGKTIAYVAASRAEKNRMTPQATDSDAGILRCYDNELFLQEIAEADANADYVVALAHWGTEYSYDLEEVQQTTGQEYIDAGADAVIGAHTHCLQGMEYYNGKPIIYSLGNYWFNEKTLDTMLLTLKITGNENKQETKVQIIPAVQSEHVTTAADTTEEKERIYSFLESISINVTIDEQGFVEEE